MVERDICYELLSAYAETDASLKAQITRHIAESLKSGTFNSVKQLAVPLRPGRPAQPELRPPKDMPRRRINSAPCWANCAHPCDSPYRVKCHRPCP
jgi:uncharacterized ferritin-like protein (DUF455 family)